MTHKNLISQTPGQPSCYGGYVEIKNFEADLANMVSDMNAFIREHGGNVLRAEIIQKHIPPTSDPEDAKNFVPTVAWKVYIYETDKQQKGE